MAHLPSLPINLGHHPPLPHVGDGSGRILSETGGTAEKLEAKLRNADTPETRLAKLILALRRPDLGGPFRDYLKGLAL